MLDPQALLVMWIVQSRGLKWKRNAMRPATGVAGRLPEMAHGSCRSESQRSLAAATPTAEERGQIRTVDVAIVVHIGRTAFAHAP
jgi:hypothetical protein